jgi:hypothetical protein
LSIEGYCRVMATTVVVFIFSLTSSVWSQGFPRGHRDALGPRYKDAPGDHRIPRRQPVGVDSHRPRTIQRRIYLGIHWTFDKTEGISQGRKVGDYVVANAFTPLHSR